MKPMKLMTKELAKKVPRLYTTEDTKDPTVWAKYFTPDAQWTWLVTEYDPDKRVCFGLVVGLDTELGYFDLGEIEELRGPLGLKVERDRYFSPKPLSECRKDAA